MEFPNKSQLWGQSQEQTLYLLPSSWSTYEKFLNILPVQYPHLQQGITMTSLQEFYEDLIWTKLKAVTELSYVKHLFAGLMHNDSFKSLHNHMN